jgi:hypothetical protein
MDNVQNCYIYINIPLSHTYRRNVSYRKGIDLNNTSNTCSANKVWSSHTSKFEHIVLTYVTSCYWHFREFISIFWVEEKPTNHHITNGITTKLAYYFYVDTLFYAGSADMKPLKSRK